MTILSPLPKLAFRDNNNNPAVGAQLFTYLSNTTTKATTYKDSSTSNPNTNPIQLDYRGECDCWLIQGQSYTFTLAPANDTDPPTNPIWTVNNINPSAILASANYAPDTGSTNAYAVLTAISVPAYVDGLRISVKIANTNTGASTLNYNTLGIKNITLQNGAALSGGELQVGGVYDFEYINPNFQLLSPALQPTQIRTAAEIAAGVTPTNYYYPELNLLRYWSGSGNIDTALSQMLDVLLNKSGGVATIPPGSYSLAATVTKSLTTSPGANVTTLGATIWAYGAKISFAGSGWAIEFTSPNTSSAYYGPLLTVYGLNIYGTASGSGGVRCSDTSVARFINCFGHSFTSGSAFGLRNTVSWCENNHFIGCGAVSCKSGISFTTSSGNSFARTTVHDFYGAGITDYWFDVGGGCSVYDSRFTHISGNNGALAIFGLGAAGSGADMTATVVDGINCELNSLVTLTFTGSLSGGATSATLTSVWTHPTGSYTVAFSNGDSRVVTLTNNATTATWTGGLSGTATSSATVQQGIIQLRDYPQNAGVERRPILYNVSSQSTFTGSGNIPVWISNTGATLTGPESAQLQSLAVQAPVISQVGQSQFLEANYGAASALRNVATLNSVLQGSINITGCTAGVSGRVSFFRTGNLAGMTVFDPLTGTSNTTAMTMTGIPAEYTPTANRTVVCYVTNNGAVTMALAQIASTGTITFFCGTAINAFSATGFTNAGTKGLTVDTTILWPLS